MSSINTKINRIASFFGVTAIILGAFGAHALKEKLSIEQLATFETGVKYQMYHALFLLFLGLQITFNEKYKKIIFYSISFGVLFFSGSIYLLATGELLGLELKFLGPITPIGGLFLIVGWSYYFLNFIKKKN
ncbi:DUF423 domain-containing protein [Flavobacterium capsici]|uniref:DUF423 domain-containing protein n=1 Tax=Flavobacterium capsici TaxID=3075618 RepID=A0AA96F4I8_9FLAO|nr:MULTISPECIES: DUF423 domain-containing protein [unclassified Flavobacterium]WNM19886.1 DUF423 domain-containing protein [Flavobacterium sp. PMR2A8]WNM21275.1 DUF423 domain-containing protein [Flavobacterium sp. PMTSA4]